MSQDTTGMAEDPRFASMLKQLASKAVDLAFSKLGLIRKVSKEGNESIDDLLKGLQDEGEGGAATATAVPPASAGPAEGPGAPVENKPLNELAVKQIRSLKNIQIENELMRIIGDMSMEGQAFFIQTYLSNLKRINEEPALAPQAHAGAITETWKFFQKEGYKKNPATLKWEKESKPVTLGGGNAPAAGAGTTPTPAKGKVVKTSSEEGITAMAGTTMEFDGKTWIVRHASLTGAKSFKTMEEAGKFVTLLAEADAVVEEKPSEEVKPESSPVSEEQPQAVVASTQGGTMSGVKVSAGTAQSKTPGTGDLVKGIPTSDGGLAGGHGKFPKASGTTVTEAPVIKTGIEAGAGKDSMKQNHEKAAQHSDAEIKRVNGQHGLMSEITKLCSTEDGMEILNEALQLVVAAKKNAIARKRSTT